MNWGMDSAEARARIRHKRANPPGQAGRGERRKVFVASLEQFDELLDAANQIGPAASPIPYFYSLSQAGRALSAAFTEGDPWQIIGHGLKFSLADGAAIGDGLVKPEPTKADAFSLVSHVVGSAKLTSAVPIRAAWSAAPYMWAPEAHSVGDPQPIRLTGETSERPQRVARLDGEVTRDLDHPSKSTEGLRARLVEYPSAANLVVRGTSYLVPSGLSIGHIAWPDGEGNDQPIESAAPRMIDGGAYFLQPGLGANRDGISSLMTWWLVLYALSSLARYYPASWVAALDPDESDLAVPIERALLAWSSTAPLALLYELERAR